MDRIITDCIETQTERAYIKFELPCAQAEPGAANRSVAVILAEGELQDSDNYVARILPGWPRLTELCCFVQLASYIVALALGWELVRWVTSRSH